MTRPLDTQALRDALRASPGPAGRVDAALIMERGRKLRRRRRIAAAAGGICAVLVLAAAATGAARVMSPAPGRHPLTPAQPEPASSSRLVPHRAPTPLPRPDHTGRRLPVLAPTEPSPGAPATATPAPTGATGTGPAGWGGTPTPALTVPAVSPTAAPGPQLTPSPSGAVAAPSPRHSG